MIKVNKNMQATPLPKREQQVLDLVYEFGNATVHDIQQALPDQPSYSATRMLLQRLHKKDLLRTERDGAKYVYKPSKTKRVAAKAAFKKLLHTFFNGSRVEAMNTLIGEEDIDEAELAELEKLLANAKASQARRRRSK